MAAAALAIALLSFAAPIQACPLVHYGRMSLGVDGLSGQCCGNVSSVVDQAAKEADAAGLMEPGNHNAAMTELKNKYSVLLSIAFLTSCCSSGDQEVFSTLTRDEPPEAAAQLAQACSQMDSHHIVNLLGERGITVLGGVSLAADAEQSRVSLGSAAAVGALAGLAGGAVVVSMLKRSAPRQPPLLA